MRQSVFVLVLLGVIPLTAVSQVPTVRTTSSLVLVDVLAQDRKSGEPVRDFQPTDFVLRDNGKPVAIASFDGGTGGHLRPVQLWFVLMCNEEANIDVPGHPEFMLNKQKWGSKFLLGRSEELRSALTHLRSNETVAVAHWCGDGKSDVDVAPTTDHNQAIKAIVAIASRKAVLMTHRQEDSRHEILRVINGMAQASFPEPFLSVVFVGGKESTTPVNAVQSASGSIEVSATDFGSDDQIGSGASLGSSAYAVQNDQYISRLGDVIDVLHSRYQLGFAPGKKNKAHHLRVALTKAAKRRHPNVLLRYRQSYGGQSQPETPSDRFDWRKLDSHMQSAIVARTPGNGLAFDVQRTPDANGSQEHYSLSIAPDALTWHKLPNGKQRSIVMAVLAYYESSTQPVATVAKELEIIQSPNLKGKPVTLSIDSVPERGARRIRVLVRDIATGRIGARDITPELQAGTNE